MLSLLLVYQLETQEEPYPFYLCPHLDIQQHLVNAPALTEPGPEAEAGSSFHIVHGT